METPRRRRFWRMLAFALVVIVLVLGGWEVVRRRNLTPWQPEMNDLAQNHSDKSRQEIDPDALRELYADPEQLRELCEQVRQFGKEIHERDQQFEHIEEQTLLELDNERNSVATERHIERVWHQDTTKYRQTIEWIDLRRNVPKDGVDYEPRKDTGKLDAVLPFSQPIGEDGYTYTFVGVKKFNGIWAIHLEYEPESSPKKRFRGEAWIDATTREPLRHVLKIAEKIPLVDAVTTILDYGTVSTGTTQVVQTVVEGSIGFAMLQKHYRLEVAIRDYRRPNPDEHPPANSNTAP